MKDPVEMFRKVFDNSAIVKQWEERGFDHVGTIFSGDEYDIAFPMDGGVAITKTTYIRTIEFDTDMLNLIYETKRFIIGLHNTCEALFGKID